MTLNENVEATSPREIAALIFRDCKPFLETIDFSRRCAEHYVYRGSKALGYKVFAELSVLKDRRPKDMPHSFHVAFNDYLVEKFGIPYRSQSLFVTSSRMDASSYGDIYCVFPMGDFTFIWDKNIDDPWIDLVDRNMWRGNYEAEDFVAYLRAHDSYQDTDFIGAVLSKNEIMIACESYYAINRSSMIGKNSEFFMAEVTRELITLYNL